MSVVVEASTFSLRVLDALVEEGLGCVAAVLLSVSLASRVDGARSASLPCRGAPPPGATGAALSARAAAARSTQQQQQAHMQR